MTTIKFLGAAGTVTGSNFLLSREREKGMLVDCGLFQGTGQDSERNRDPLGFDINSLGGVVLTHAHLDHCGGLPMLLKAGFKGKIYMTPATKELVKIVLEDAARIYLNAPPETREMTPLYTQDDVGHTLEAIETVDYHKLFSVGSYQITFKDAGHILGSASVVIEEKSADGKIKTIVFSGDLGNSPDELLNPTEYISRAETVVMESTYGDKTHTGEDPREIIQEEINAIEKNQGVLLIPAFSLERTQEILHHIAHLKREGRISEQTPVFLDSPMAIAATSVYKRYRSLYNQTLAAEPRHCDPFNFPGLKMAHSFEESKKIRDVGRPKVIIAGSGMMSGGRILHHALIYLPHETTRLLIVGYQAEDTLGHQIEIGERKITIEGYPVEVRALVRETSSMSAHADQPKLLKWLSEIQGVRKLFLVHGENQARRILAEKIKQDLHLQDIILPEINQVETID